MHEIVRPNAEHAEVLASLGKQTLAETFVGLAYYTQEIVDGYTQKAFVPSEIASELLSPKISYFLLCVNSSFHGYAKLSEKPSAACLGDLPAIYLERIYLTKAVQRQGFGTLLLEAAYTEARQRNYEWLWLSVWEYNQPAVAFYEKHGFQNVGKWDWAFESCGVRYVDRDCVMLIKVPPHAG